MSQPDLFAAIRPAAPPPSDIPDPALVRARLHAMLATARGAEAMPWPPTRARVQAILFHNMANWLPAAERESLRAAFAAEFARLREAS